MKYYYVVTDLDGREIMRGSAQACADRFGVTDRIIYGISEGTELGINVFRKPIEKVRKKIQQETILDRLRLAFKLYDNTVLGKESQEAVKKAMKQLAKEGIYVNAEFRKDHWYLERVKL